MRLSTAQIFQQGIDNILTRQADVQQTQQQLATGRRVSTPADDPIAAVRILDITEDVQRVEQYERNGDFAESQLAFEETVLADVANVLQRVRELAVTANNASQSTESRRSIAVEVDARLEELVTLANAQDSTGEYIFAGYQAGEQPFSRSGGDVVYSGDDGQRSLQISGTTPVAVRDPGNAVFLDVPAGNGRFAIEADDANAGTTTVRDTGADSSYQRDDYSINFLQAAPGDPITYEVVDSSAAVVAAGNYESGEVIAFNGAEVVFEGEPVVGDSFNIPASPNQDMFTTLQSIATSLRGAGDAPAEVAAVNNAMANGLRNIDQALGVALEKRADVGVRLSRVESQLGINEDFTLQLQETLSDIQDLDYAEAISRLNLQLVALEAAQQTYVRTQGLTLFNFL
ncbi:MAG: flagellar hook-associated protein FlgL [Chromatocurvus sp.]